MDASAIDALKQDILDDMREYMEDVKSDGGDPGYTAEDIDTCGVILSSFLSQVRSTAYGHHDTVLGIVGTTVRALNALAEARDGMIETDQREQICELINKAAFAAGVGDGKEDLTEEWREW